MNCERCGLAIEPGDSYEYVLGGSLHSYSSDYSLGGGRQHSLQRCFDVVVKALNEARAGLIAAGSAAAGQAESETIKLQSKLSEVTADRDRKAELLQTAYDDLKALAVKAGFTSGRSA